MKIDVKDTANTFLMLAAKVFVAGVVAVGTGAGLRIGDELGIKIYDKARRDK